MKDNPTTGSALVYDALVREAGFRREETLQCIKHVRNLAVQSTYIAGFALPIIAGLLGADASTTFPVVGLRLDAATTIVVVQFICFGVSLSSLALLRIYLGTFLQIFTIAKYFREHLIPAVNEVVNQSDFELFHWEEWLKSNRSKKVASVGDVDLAAEPILMGLYTVIYGVGFVTIGVWQQSYLIPSVVLGAMVGLLTVLSFIKFSKVLRSAASD